MIHVKIGDLEVSCSTTIELREILETIGAINGRERIEENPSSLASPPGLAVEEAGGEQDIPMKDFSLLDLMVERGSLPNRELYGYLNARTRAAKPAFLAWASNVGLAPEAFEEVKENGIKITKLTDFGIYEAKMILDRQALENYGLRENGNGETKAEENQVTTAS